MPLQINDHAARARLACVSTVTGLPRDHKDGFAMIDHTAERPTDGNVLIVNGIFGVSEGQDGIREAAIDVVYRHITAGGTDIAGDQIDVTCLEHRIWLRDFSVHCPAIKRGVEGEVRFGH